jgi:hypothetical protein
MSIVRSWVVALPCLLLVATLAGCPNATAGADFTRTDDPCTATPPRRADAHDAGAREHDAPDDARTRRRAAARPARHHRPPAPAGRSHRVLGKSLTQEEAVAIALETQPSIQARLSDYLAAAYRVDQAFSPLLPQLTGSATLARTQSAISTTTSPVRARWWQRSSRCPAATRP